MGSGCSTTKAPVIFSGFIESDCGDTRGFSGRFFGCCSRFYSQHKHTMSFERACANEIDALRLCKLKLGYEYKECYDTSSYKNECDREVYITLHISMKVISFYYK